APRRARRAQHPDLHRQSMARARATPWQAYASRMAGDRKTALGTKLLFVLGLIFAIWIAANVLGDVIGWIFSFFGYILVGVVAYFIGQSGGKANSLPAQPAAPERAPRRNTRE